MSPMTGVIELTLASDFPAGDRRRWGTVLDSPSEQAQRRPDGREAWSLLTSRAGPQRPLEEGMPIRGSHTKNHHSFPIRPYQMAGPRGLAEPVAAPKRAEYPPSNLDVKRCEPPAARHHEMYVEEPTSDP